MTWSTTAPPECVGSVRVEFRTNALGAPVATAYTTTNTSETEVIQTGLQCVTNYYIIVVVTGRLPGSVFTTRSRAVGVLVGGKYSNIYQLSYNNLTVVTVLHRYTHSS